MIAGVVNAYGATYEFDWPKGNPVTYNEEALAEASLPALASVVGRERVVSPPPQMGAEDFALYQQRIPGLYFFLWQRGEEHHGDDPHRVLRHGRGRRGDLAFDATAGTNTIGIDSDGVQGLSPMQSLALALASCMAVDVVMILQKGRHDLQALEVRLDGTRHDGPPAYFTDIRLHYALKGSAPADAVQRAIDLSRDTYCSVWHSMRPDIRLDVTFNDRVMSRILRPGRLVAALRSSSLACHTWRSRRRGPG